MFDGFMKIVQVIFTMIAFFVIHKNISFIKFTITQYCFTCSIVGGSYMVLECICNDIAPLSLYVVPIVFMYLRNRKFIKSFVAHTIACLIVIFVDGIVSNILILILGDKFIENDLCAVFVLIILVFASLYISKFISYIFNKYKGWVLDNYKSRYAIVMYFLLSIVFILLFITINSNRPKDIIVLIKSTSVLFIICALILVFVSYVLFSIARKEIQFMYKERELDNLKEYTENLEKIYTDMRKFRHDYINIIASISGYIDEGDIEGLAEYFSKNIYPLNSKINNNNYKLGLLKNIRLPEIKGLVSSKIIHAQELGIEVGIDIVEPINNIKMDIIDFIRCLGIIMDNAVEAAIESEEKVLNIAFINKDNSIIVVVENTFPYKLPPVHEMFKYGFSAKGKNRGIGLSNLREITNRYKNISLETIVKEGKFVQNLCICNEY